MSDERLTKDATKSNLYATQKTFDRFDGSRVARTGVSDAIDAAASSSRRSSARANAGASRRGREEAGARCRGNAEDGNGGRLDV